MANAAIQANCINVNGACTSLKCHPHSPANDYLSISRHGSLGPLIKLERCQLDNTTEGFYIPGGTISTNINPILIGPDGLA